ncbi:hypothetical protein BpsS36_00019 [Bacillus phage vB_BpsS-36]|uniref:Uncharacterized protein n=1 Tax=Bacillus phage vB_BpsS-36 TaxID=2419622 RepID=A0A3G3BWQ6_9CAUD|nr:hypothetical protein BpsS36_00019 [Bacillus phage vB_BpsS-36]
MEYELCKAFHCLPSQLYKEDNRIIEEFMIIMETVNEHEKKGDRKNKRDQLKKKHGGNARR